MLETGQAGMGCGPWGLRDDIWLGSPVVPVALFVGSRFPYEAKTPEKEGTVIMPFCLVQGSLMK